MPSGISKKLELPRIAIILFCVLLELDNQEVVISPLAPAMVDDDVWQNLVRRLPRIASRDPHKRFLLLPVTVILTIHVSCLEMRLELHGETVGGRALMNSFEFEYRAFPSHRFDRSRDSVSDLIVCHDRQFYSDFGIARIIARTPHED